VDVLETSLKIGVMNLLLSAVLGVTKVNLIANLVLVPGVMDLRRIKVMKKKMKVMMVKMMMKMMKKKIMVKMKKMKTKVMMVKTMTKKKKIMVKTMKMKMKEMIKTSKNYVILIIVDVLDLSPTLGVEFNLLN